METTNWQTHLSTTLRELTSQASDLEGQLATIRDTIKALGRPRTKGPMRVAKGKAKRAPRKMTRAGRAAISKAARKRWAAWRKAKAGKS